MKIFSPAVLAYLGRRDGMVAKSLMWVIGRNRSSGAPEPVGVWTGDQDMEFTIRGTVRAYAGEGALHPMDPIVQRAGTDVRLLRVLLNPLDPTVTRLVRVLDVGQAPAEIHRAFFDPLTGDLIEEPQRVWKGFVDQGPITTPQIGNQALIEMTLASSARALHRGLTLTKSDVVQRLRGGDEIRQYGDVSGKVKTYWGSKRPEGDVFAPGTGPKPRPGLRSSER